MTESTKPTATWRVVGLSQGLDEAEESLRARALEQAGVEPAELRGLRIGHKALDARRRGGRRSLRFIVHVDLILDAAHEQRASGRFREALKSGRVVARAEPGHFEVDDRDASMSACRVAVVGSGPAGLFAALTLARNGVAVDLIERGPVLAERSHGLAQFLRSRKLDPECNLLYGEGGAGTYSDGKIYTRVDHPLEAPILEELIACGAPPEIAYDARAHIGTDRLHRILPKLRSQLTDLGVTIHWNTRLEGLLFHERTPDRVRALATTRGEIPCDAVFLALGHSARDTLRQLMKNGLTLEPKPFQLGVRIEHPQQLIDRGRYGDPKLSSKLGASYYGLVAKASAQAPSAHSFCMCPGGQIVASVSEPGLLCTNGMSNSRHSSPWANAALVTTLGPADFGTDPLAGADFQETLERAFFSEGGNDYTAPAQRAPDFLAGRLSPDPGASSYKFGLTPARIDSLLPARVHAALCHALQRFDHQIPGYAGPEALLVGIESRSSCPFRIPRNERTRRATNFSNLLPIGEGAGHAGGIMSAAIDGARSAHALLRTGLPT